MDNCNKVIYFLLLLILIVSLYITYKKEHFYQAELSTTQGTTFEINQGTTQGTTFEINQGTTQGATKSVVSETYVTEQELINMDINIPKFFVHLKFSCENCDSHGKSSEKTHSCCRELLNKIRTSNESAIKFILENSLSLLDVNIYFKNEKENNKLNYKLCIDEDNCKYYSLIKNIDMYYWLLQKQLYNEEDVQSVRNKGEIIEQTPKEGMDKNSIFNPTYFINTQSPKTFNINYYTNDLDLFIGGNIQKFYKNEDKLRIPTTTIPTKTIIPTYNSPTQIIDNSPPTNAVKTTVKVKHKDMPPHYHHCHN